MSKFRELVPKVQFPIALLDLLSYDELYSSLRNAAKGLNYPKAMHTYVLHEDFQ